MRGFTASLSAPLIPSPPSDVFPRFVGVLPLEHLQHLRVVDFGPINWRDLFGRLELLRWLAIIDYDSESTGLIEDLITEIPPGAILGLEQGPRLYFPSLRGLGITGWGYDTVEFEIGSPIFDRLIAAMEKRNKYRLPIPHITLVRDTVAISQDQLESLSQVVGEIVWHRL